MSLFPDVTINWDGKSYTFTPTLRWVASMEKIGLSPLKIAVQWHSGDLNRASGSMLLAHALNSVGADVKEDDVFTALYSDSAANEVLGQFLLAMIPPQKEEAGNEEAPEAA